MGNNDEGIIEECMGCIYDKITDNCDEFWEILYNCQQCKRAYIEGSDESKTFKDRYKCIS